MRKLLFKSVCCLLAFASFAFAKGESKVKTKQSEINSPASVQTVPPPNPVAENTKKKNIITVTIEDKDVFSVTGNLTKKQVLDTVASFIGQLEYCYEQELDKSNDKKDGEVTNTFTIDPNGSVIDVVTDASSLPYENTKSCMKAVYRLIKFPKPTQGYVTVRTKLVFGFK